MRAVVLPQQMLSKHRYSIAVGPSLVPEVLAAGSRMRGTRRADITRKDVTAAAERGRAEARAHHEQTASWGPLGLAIRRVVSLSRNLPDVALHRVQHEHCRGPLPGVLLTPVLLES